MKTLTLPRSFVMVLLALFLTGPAAFAQGAAFSYQGRLNDSDAPATGLYDFRFRLFSTLTDGSPVGNVLALDAVPVSNGLFRVTLAFAGSPFDGSARWLDIGVRTNASPDGYLNLAPRQEITSTPYAIRAQSAATALDVNPGTVVKSLNTLKDAVTLAAGTNVTITPNGNSLTISSAGAGGSGIWSVLNNNAYYNAGNVGIGTASPTTKLTVRTGTGFYGLLHTDGAISVGSYIGGSSSGASGGWLGTLSNHPLYLFVNNGQPSMTVDPLGNVGIGTALPSGRLQVAGDWNGEQGALQLSGHRPTIRFTGDADTGNQSWIMHLGGVGPGALYFMRRTGPAAWSPVLALNPNNDVILNPASGNVGIGSPTPQAKLEVVAQDALRLVGYQPFLTLLDNNAGYARSRVQGLGGEMVLEPESFINGSDANAYVKLFNSGNLSVKSLTIRGGADLAEPFEFSVPEVTKGSVVIIDPENPGKLKLTDQSYDRRVAGVVSGANGINPGISISQQGLNDAGENVALTGRVYVQADAAFGAIQPGDLLTTSATAGHAMKVTDHARAQGAILGKAMSSLKTGKGMVLVLVTLQ